MYAIRILRITRGIVVVGFCSLAYGRLVCAQTDLDFIARRDSKVTGQVVAVGDFNGDRHQDLVTAQESTLYIQLGNKDGRFTAGRDAQVGGTAVAVTVGDFNRDGRLDLATANGDSGTISVLLGRGDGSFRVARNFRVGGAPNSIAVGDFNKDGRQDLATANGDSGTVSVLLGRGDGSFLATRNFQVGGAPGLLTVGDFDGDKRQDVAVANGGILSVLLGKGNGTFQLAVDTDVGWWGWSVSSIAVGEFNGDGREDLAVTSFACDDLSCGGSSFILLATENGRFQVTDIGVMARAVRIGNFNGDGRQDLAVADFQVVDCREFCDYDYGISVLLGQGDGVFQGTGRFVVGRGHFPFSLGDFDADGRQDLAIETGLDTVSILLGRGDGSFQDASDFPLSRYGVDVRIGDFNGDGRQDLATLGIFVHCDGGCEDVALQILLNKGDGTFEYGVAFSGLPFAVGDFNGDGRSDLVLFSSNTVSILLSKRDGTFQDPKSFRVGGIASSVTVGDFNGDRRQDLAIGNTSGFGGVLGSISIFLSKGDGTFQVASVLARKPGPMTVDDFNSDGRQDLAIADSSSSTVSVLLSNGNGTFQVARNFIVGDQPGSIAVADFNGDGRQDLATANSGSNTVSILLGGGDGTFQPALTVQQGAGSPSAADFDSDGREDLAVFNSGSRNVSILLGRGDGTFESARDFGVGGQFTSGVVADFNGDGLPDLATDFVSILINNSAIKVPINILHEKVNPKSHGFVSVAILTSHSFDATTVDTTTVHFGATGTEAAPVRVDLRDVDHDGDIDMVLSFEIQQTGLRCGNTSVSLQGKTLTGQFIRGSDSIQTIGCLQNQSLKL